MCTQKIKQKPTHALTLQGLRAGFSDHPIPQPAGAVEKAAVSAQSPGRLRRGDLRLWLMAEGYTAAAEGRFITPLPTPAALCTSRSDGWRCLVPARPDSV